MSYNKVILVLGLVNLGAWSYKVNNHFFDYQFADELGLLASFILPFLISSKLKGVRNAPFWSASLAILLLTASLYPLLSYALQRTDYAWVIPNVLFGTLGVLLGIGQPGISKAAPVVLLGCAVWFMPFSFIQDQSLYFDHLVESTTTRQGKIHRVRWKGEEWIHYNGRLSAATIDAHLYYEPLVHPALSLVGAKPEVLLIGGDNGLALKELSKYAPSRLQVIPFDVDFFQKSTREKSTIVAEDPFVWLHETASLYDVIIVDLPDPINAVTNQYYTLEFYELCKQHLSENGLLVTQASSPYFHPEIHQSIKTTISATGLQVVNYHNQVPTIGQWGWVIGTLREEDLKTQLKTVNNKVPTRWWNNEAMQMMLSFGKEAYFNHSPPEINTIKSPLFVRKPE